MKRILLGFLLFISTALVANVLTWVAPAERADNSPLSLSDIAGYKLYCGTLSQTYDTSYLIDDSSATSQDIKSLGMALGIHYCAITTFDIDGRESKFSEELTIVVRMNKANPKPPTVLPNTVINVYTL